MYDEDGNRRRLFSGSSAGGGMSSGGSASSQARTESLPGPASVRCPTLVLQNWLSGRLQRSILESRTQGSEPCHSYRDPRTVVCSSLRKCVLRHAQGSTVYMSCAGGSRRTSSNATEPPLTSSQLHGELTLHLTFTRTLTFGHILNPLLMLMLMLVHMLDGKRGSSGSGWGRPSTADRDDVCGGIEAPLVDTQEDVDRGLLSAESLLYDSTGARRNTRFWRKS